MCLYFSSKMTCLVTLCSSKFIHYIRYTEILLYTYVSYLLHLALVCCFVFSTNTCRIYKNVVPSPVSYHWTHTHTHTHTCTCAQTNRQVCQTNTNQLTYMPPLRLFFTLQEQRNGTQWYITRSSMYYSYLVRICYMLLSPI